MLSSTICGSAAIVARGVVVEAVAGVAFEAERRGLRRGDAQPAEFVIAALALPVRQRVAPGAGVQLDHRRAQATAAASSASIEGSMNSETRIAGAVELGDKGLEMVVAADHVEAALGGALGALFRHQAAGVRTDAQRDVEHLLGRRHLEIQRLRDRRLQPAHVVVANVAAILAQMRGDAVGPRFDRDQRRAHRIGNRAAARVAHRRDVIDVDAQPQFGHRRTPCQFSPRPLAGGPVRLRPGERAAARLDRGQSRRARAAARRRDRRECRASPARRAATPMLGLAARAVDQAGRADDLARMFGDRRQAFARRQAGGDDVLDHQHARARRDDEAAPQLERRRSRARRRSPWRRASAPSRSPARCRRPPAKRRRRSRRRRPRPSAPARGTDARCAPGPGRRTSSAGTPANAGRKTE